MGCSGCSSGGCGSELPRGCKNNGSCGSGGCNKLSVFDWLSNIKNQLMKRALMVLKFALRGVVKSFIITQKKFLCKLVM